MTKRESNRPDRIEQGLVPPKSVVTNYEGGTVPPKAPRVPSPKPKQPKRDRGEHNG